MYADATIHDDEEDDDLLDSDVNLNQPLIDNVST